MSISFPSFQAPLLNAALGDPLEQKKKKKTPQQAQEERDAFMDGLTFQQRQQFGQGVSSVTPNFSSSGLYDALELDDQEDITNSTTTTETAGEIPSFAMLETVKKRQDNDSIHTQDVIDDFLKTAHMLGAGETFENNMQRYFDVIRIETHFELPNTKLIKHTFSGLAKRLDEKVSNTLGEASSVVQDWLDALFTQPIVWDAPIQGVSTAPVTESRHESKNETLTLDKHLHQLLIQDSSKKTIQALKEKAYPKAEEHITRVLSLSDGMDSEVKTHWETVLVKVLHKQGKYDSVLTQAVQRNIDQVPQIQPLIADAYAKTGAHADAVKTLYAYLTLSANGKKVDGKNIAHWTQLNEWTQALKNPALEEKMLKSLWRVVTAHQGLLSDTTLNHLGKLQRLAFIQGDKTMALTIAKHRVVKSRENQNKATYTTSLQELAALFVSVGQMHNAEKVLSLVPIF